MTDKTSKPVAVVTGAAGDIGAAIAAHLSHSHRVAAVDIDLEALKGTVSSLSQGGTDITPFRCDLTDAADLKRLGEAVRQIGQVDTLINNAGAAASLTLHQMTTETLASDVALNLEAALNCFKTFEQDLIGSGSGTVVNIASVNGLAAFGHPAYSAAKAGLIHATRAIAVEYGKYGIRANAVAPGTVKTQAWKIRQEANPDVFEEALSWYPFKTLPEPSDIAEAVAFLVSPSARCITGVCLPVDSGLTAGSPALPRTFTQSSDFDGL
ncbi:SDR family oxidoreductase [Roseibium sp.]|uniref:SDR family oxidoreductase n=1 Tax=Roseibium sp. TaxID=1936156 RepID=UPI003D0FDC50